MSDHPVPPEHGEKAQQVHVGDSPSPTHQRFPSRRIWLIAKALALALLLFAGFAWWCDWFDWRHSSPPENPFPVPPISTSPFLNTKPGASFVGSESCVACHEARTASFRRTGMGVSTTVVDPAQEPPDAVFDHPGSKRRYQITRKDGMVWHRELLIASADQEIVLSEYPLKYGIGSGRYGRTYVVETDGFLAQSPVTWYATREKWDMSPGYDRPDHQGFERPINEGCLVCHAGHAEAFGKSQHRIRISEPAISCERCHGPGSLHVEHHRARKQNGDAAAPDIDYTIVNPRHLERDLAEAVCQQCHLQSAAIVLGRGRKVADFRPGLHLQDFRQDYRLEVDNAPMRVVGHVEQLHLSQCYKGSPTLSCATCHNPHAFPEPEKRGEYYQKKCLNCHQPEKCTVDGAARKRESPNNQCVQCHMPSAGTDVPHVSFTHHRIGIHRKEVAAMAGAASGPDRTGVLRPFFDYFRLSEMDRKRSMGLAYGDMALNEPVPRISAHYRNEGLRLLSTVRAAGIRDPAFEVMLTQLQFDNAEPQMLSFAQEILTRPDLAPADRCAALFFIASEHLRRKQFQEAKNAYLELVTLRRLSDDWVFLAKCEKALGNQPGHIRALQAAVQINPRIWPIHQQLAEHFRRLGDRDAAKYHQDRAVP